MKITYAHDNFVCSDIEKIVVTEDELGNYVLVCYPIDCENEDDALYIVLKSFLPHTDLIIEKG